MIEANIIRSDDALEIDFQSGRIFFKRKSGDNKFSSYDDFAVWALLPIAMKSGQKIVIHGRVHEKVARCAEQFAFIWHNWMPIHFLPVEVVADEVVDEPPVSGAGRSLLALSGGVDSTFSLLRNTQAGITHVLTIHGMDYFLSDEEVFAGVHERTSKIAEMAGKKQILLETNVREFMKDNWWMTHAPAITAAMSCFSEEFDVRYIASDRPRWMDNILTFSGGNHITNECLHADGHGISHLDDDLDRIDKLAFIIDEHPEYSELVTFCFKRHVPGNCGWCYKCSTQKLYLLALQGHLDPFFPGQELTERNIRKLRKYQDAQFRVYLMKALSMAHGRGNEAVVPLLEKLLEENLKGWRTLCKFDSNNLKYMAMQKFLMRLRGKGGLGKVAYDGKGIHEGYVDYVLRRRKAKVDT